MDQLEIDYTTAVTLALSEAALESADSWRMHVGRTLTENGAAPSLRVITRMHTSGYTGLQIPVSLANELVERVEGEEKGSIYEAMRGDNLLLLAARLAEHGAPHYHIGESGAQIGDDGLEAFLLLDGQAQVWETEDGTDPKEAQWKSQPSTTLKPGHVYEGHPNQGHFVERVGQTPLLVALVCPPSHMDPAQNYHKINPPGI